jgi:hypothetical protein
MSWTTESRYPSAMASYLFLFIGPGEGTKGKRPRCAGTKSAADFCLQRECGGIIHRP